jgi:hypothetical protein
MREQPRRQVCFNVVDSDGSRQQFYLGAHAPHFTEDDISLIHKLWLEVGKVPARHRVRHRDVVRVALDRLERDLRGQGDVMLDFYKLEHKTGHENSTVRDAKKVRRDVPTPD